MKLFKYLLIMLMFVPFSFVNAQGRGDKATPVIVTKVERKAFSDEVEALGTLRANESVDITSTVTELVTSVLFDDNQSVKKGDVLLEMDSAEEKAELAEQHEMPLIY
jgi:membrane fusion protein (multidrug efflux system)